MDKRKLDTSRLYRLTKTIVLAITSIAIVITLYTGYMSGFGTDVLLHRWDRYCSENPDDPEIVRLTGLTCMSIGLEQVNQSNDTFWKAFLIAILLPSSFFSGTALYKYLFPIGDKDEELISRQYDKRDK